MGVDLLLGNVMEEGEGVKNGQKLCYVINEWPLMLHEPSDLTLIVYYRRVSDVHTKIKK